MVQPYLTVWALWTSVAKSNSLWIRTLFLRPTLPLWIFHQTHFSASYQTVVAVLELWEGTGCSTLIRCRLSLNQGNSTVQTQDKRENLIVLGFEMSHSLCRFTFVRIQPPLRFLQKEQSQVS